MKKLSCAIIDDDLLSQAILERLSNDSGLLEVIAKYDAATKALPWLMSNNVDLLFLDIEMPGMTGLEMLRSIPGKPNVIIVSAKKEYAHDAFDLAVVDYLVKPIKDYSRFLASISKAMAYHQQKPEKESGENSLFVKVDSLLIKIDLDTILWVEAFGDYIKIKTNDKVHLVYSTLKKAEEKLDKTKFIRVHRSYLVNVSKITNVDPNNLEINKNIIPISGTYKEELLSKLNVL